MSDEAQLRDGSIAKVAAQDPAMVSARSEVVDPKGSHGLKARFVVQGRVTSSSTKGGVRGAVVQCYTFSRSFTQLATTGAGGSYRFEFSEAGAYCFAVGNVRHYGVAVSGEEPSVTLDLELPPNSSRRVVAVNDAGEPVPNASIWMRPLGNDLAIAVACGETGTTGGAEVFGAVEECEIIGRHAELGVSAVARIEGLSHSVCELRFRSQTQFHCAVEVVDSAHVPVDGVVITLIEDSLPNFARQARTDPSGTVRLDGVVAGGLTIIAVHSLFAPSQTRHSSVPTGVARKERVVLGGGASVEGVVTDESGVAVVGLHVGAREVGGGYSVGAITSNFGSFRLERVPLGEIALCVYRNQEKIDAQKIVEVGHHGQRLAWNPVVQSQQVLLSGVVEGLDPKVDYALQVLSQDDVPLFDVEIGEFGEFQVEGNCSQPVVLRLVKSNRPNLSLLAVSDLHVPAHNLVLKLDRARLGAIAGQLIGSLGDTMPSLAVRRSGQRSYDEVKVSEDGSFAEDELQSGFYDVVIYGAGYQERVIDAVEVLPGQQAILGQVVIVRSVTITVALLESTEASVAQVAIRDLKGGLVDYLKRRPGSHVWEGRAPSGDSIIDVSGRGLAWTQKKIHISGHGGYHVDLEPLQGRDVRIPWGEFGFNGDETVQITLRGGRSQIVASGKWSDLVRWTPTCLTEGVYEMSAASSRERFSQRLEVGN